MSIIDWIKSIIELLLVIVVIITTVFEERIAELEHELFAKLKRKHFRIHKK